jgi:hypothetical protein
MNIFRSPSFRENVRIGLYALLALIVLNIGLAHQNVWPTLWIRATPEYSLELVVLVTVLGLAAIFGRHAGARAQWAIAGVLLIYVLARYVDVTAPALFGRRIDLYWDTQHIPAVGAMVIQSWSVFAILGLVLAIVAVFAAILFATRHSVGAICRAYRVPAFRTGMLGTGIVLLSIYIAGMSSPGLAWEREFAIPITPVYFEQAETLVARATGNFLQEDTEARPLRPYAELNGADVFVLFLESYGRIALDDAAYSDATRATLSEIDTALNEDGWQARSGFLTAPTFGGSSWLSHASFLSGNHVNTHDRYQSFLHSSAEHLTDRFRKAGYRSVLLSPGIRGAWPAGLSMRFDRIVAASDIDYDGQGFGWWYIPDQYSLEWLYRNEIELSDRKPLFVMYPTIMSHFPFGPAPPYLDDWSKLTTEMPYDEADVARTVAFGDAFSGDPKDAYRRVIQYDLEIVAGFVKERAPDNAIVIALGDHQPPAAIAGEGAVWDVPVHVFARDPNLLRAFERAGFAQGMIPQGMSVWRVADLNEILLETLERNATADRIAGVD